MSAFFVRRPVFAIVIAAVIMLAGIVSIFSLPIAQYPSIAPPAVTVTATYPGASAETMENAVTQVIEQQLKGLDHLLYFSSTSSSNGQAVITVTFAAGTNPDIAQVQVQNKLQSAIPILPTQVQQQGLLVAKSQVSVLLVVALYGTDGKHSSLDVSDYLNSNFVDPLSRVNGVGDLQVFGGQYAMRVWLDPYKLNNYNLMPSDVRAAIEAQNVQVSAGEVGALPAPPGQALDATVTAQSFLQTPEQFKAIILRSQPDGSVVHLSDVARVELGGENYSVEARFNGRPAAGIAVKLAPGANALQTADAVKKRAAELAKSLPPGLALDFPVDNTQFVRLSIKDVVFTLLEAIGLVVVVMFIFLQNWRVTLIPALAVPIVLLGTFGVLAAFGYSINTLTMFAMVLAIGLLVDDAIVVVENVERIMEEEGLSPREATLKSMTEITGALVGIGLVLSAVFLPMAFLGGSTGVIYRQFSVTIVSAVVLSVIVALVVTPALCATLLKPTKKGERANSRGFFGWFNRTFDGTVTRYSGILGKIIGRPWPIMILYFLVLAAMGLLFVTLPSSFLPDEDQGFMVALINLPAGAPESRTLEVGGRMVKYFQKNEAGNVSAIFNVAGFNFSGNGQNLGQLFIRMKDWKLRKGAKNHAPAIAQRAMAAFSKEPDARIFVIVPPAVQELGNASGFDLELEDQAGLGHDKLLAARNQLLGMASQDKLLAGVRPNGQEDTPQLHLDIDHERAGALGLAQGDIFDTLSSAWGGVFINNFLDRGRVKKVYMQGDAPYRSSPEDLGRWYVRGTSGTMAPFSAFSTTDWVTGPAQLQRYNGIPAMEIQGQAAPGKSSGAAIKEMETLLAKMPKGVGYELTGLSYQEQLSGQQGPFLIGFSLLVVFLCLAALYESWSIPVAVMLIVPLGVFGALVAASLRGLYNDVYFQVGLLTTIGLSAKNAILIVQFADEAEKNGESAHDAAMEAARLRLRPILMTSLAFVVGVLPLAISTGAGAGSQNDIGTGVIGGVIAATALAIFFVPLFYVGVRHTFRTRDKPKGDADGTPEPNPPAPSPEPRALPAPT
jgi:multidrug efflux pump